MELLVRLIIAIVVTVLVCTLKYFKNATSDAKKRNGKRMIIWGVWLRFVCGSYVSLHLAAYGIFGLFEISLIRGLIYSVAILFNVVALLLLIIGFVLCVVSNKKHPVTKSVKTNINLNTDAQQAESTVDDIKLF